MLIKEKGREGERAKRTDVPDHLLNVPQKRSYFSSRRVLTEEQLLCVPCGVRFVIRRTIQADGGSVRYRYCPQCGLAGPKTWTSDLK